MAKANICVYRGEPAVRWRDLSGKQRLKRCPTKRAAEALASKLNFYFSQGVNFDPDAAPIEKAPSSLWEVIDRYTELKVSSLTGRTPAIYVRRLDWFLDFLDATQRERFYGGAGGVFPPVTLLSRPLLEDFFAWLQRPDNRHPTRPRSVHGCGEIVSSIEQCWAWADDSERWADLPRPRRIEKPQRSEGTVIAPRYEDWDAMLVELYAALSGTHRHKERQDYDPFWSVKLGIWMRYTGMRRTASLLLETSAIDLAGEILIIPGEITKGKYGGRTIPLHPDLKERLRAWEMKPGRLFQAPPSEVPPRPGSVQQSFRRAWKRAGVAPARYEGRPLHGARHMIETEWAARNIPDRVIDLYLGHKLQGTGRKNYLERQRQWPQLLEAVHQMPAVALPVLR